MFLNLMCLPKLSTPLAQLFPTRTSNFTQTFGDHLGLLNLPDSVRI